MFKGQRRREGCVFKVLCSVCGMGSSSALCANRLGSLGNPRLSTTQRLGGLRSFIIQSISPATSTAERGQLTVSRILEVDVGITERAASDHVSANAD